MKLIEKKIYSINIVKLFIDIILNNLIIIFFLFVINKLLDKNFLFYFKYRKLLISGKKMLNQIFDKKKVLFSSKFQLIIKILNSRNFSSILTRGVKHMKKKLFL